jgi:competence ComEA-like helix-hairpin-helix protein
MSKSITSMGKAWEWLNSIWMLWTILTFGFLNFISFFYIAYRVKQRKWTIWGFIYSIPFIFYIFLIELVTEDHWLVTFGFVLLMVMWIVSIFHVIKIRPEYLLRLEAQKGRLNKELDDLRKTIAKEYKQPFEKELSPFTINQNQENEKSAESKQQPQLIDINTASEKEIASISAIGVILAKKVVTIREETGGFQSLEHFGQLLQLKPHVLERIKSNVTFSSIQNPNNQQDVTSGRVVDY